MFVLWNCLVACHSRLNTSASEFHDSMMNTYGISLCEKTEGSIKYKANLPVFGSCNICVYVPKGFPIGHVYIVTERKLSEEEMLPMLDYMKQSMPGEPYFDDHGYHGVKPKPHEIELIWEMDQGKIDMHWNGFRYDSGNVPLGDGYDYVRLDLWDCSSIRRFRDEAYWRSEVD